MAPEQASGQRRRVTTATDVYGLGAMLYALIAGRAPFEAESAAETLTSRWFVTGRSNRRQSACPMISDDLEIIVLECLEKEPERRYSSAAALADDPGRYLPGVHGA